MYNASEIKKNKVTFTNIFLKIRFIDQCENIGPIIVYSGSMNDYFKAIQGIKITDIPHIYPAHSKNIKKISFKAIIRCII